MYQKIYKKEVARGAINDIINTEDSFKTIASKWGLKIDYIYNLNKCRFKWMRDEGYVSPLRKTTHDIKKEIAERFLEGATEKQIEIEFKLTKTQVQKIAYDVRKGIERGKYRGGK